MEMPLCPIHQFLAGAQYSPLGWQVLHDEIDSRAGAGGYLSAVKTVSGNDTAGAVPDRLPGLARATLEQFLHHLDATIGDRAARLTNKTRADALLNLLAAQRNGWVNETAWAQRIREHLFAHRGRAATNASTPTQPPSPACAHLCHGHKSRFLTPPSCRHPR